MHQTLELPGLDKNPEHIIWDQTFNYAKMKLSPIFALIAETWAQEAPSTTDLSLDELFESAINEVAR